MVTLAAVLAVFVLCIKWAPVAVPATLRFFIGGIPGAVVGALLGLILWAILSR